MRRRGNDRHDQRPRRGQHARSTSSRARRASISTRRRPVSTSTCPSAPPERHLLAAAVQERSAICSTTATRFPGLPNSAQQTSWRKTGSMTCVRRSAPAWSTSCAAASRPRRRSSVKSLPTSSEPGRPGINFPANTWTDPTHTRAGAAQHHDLERREHAELAQGQPQLHDGRLLCRRPEPSGRVDECHDPHPRVRHQHRPGGGHVRRRQLPGRVSRAADGSAQPLRDPDRPDHGILGNEARLDSASGEYVYNGLFSQKSRQTSLAAFFQDRGACRRP